MQHFDANDKKAIRRSPLAKAIFETDGVKNVFLGRDFITITKKPREQWPILKTILFSVILDFMSSQQPIIIDDNTPLITDTTIDEENDSEIVMLIKELLETKIRPTVQDDGGDIFYEGFDEQSGKRNDHR